MKPQPGRVKLKALLILSALLYGLLALPLAGRAAGERFPWPVSLGKIFGSRAATPLSAPVLIDAVGDYRSVATGNWNAPGTWETFDGANWVAAVTSPTSADGVITIRSGNTVTISVSGLSYDQVTVDSGGQVTVAGAIGSTLADGTGTDLTINGKWLNSGATWVATGTWQVKAGGTYIHNTSSGVATPLNQATLDSGSNFIYRGATGLSPSISTANRTYSNLAFESTAGTWTASASGSTPLTINGDFAIGSGVTYSTTQTGVMTFAGNFTNDGTLTNSTGTQIYTFTGSDKIINGSGVIGFETWNVNSGASITLGTNVDVGSTFTGTISGTLNCGTNLVTGAGTFTMVPGATLGIGSTAGIASSGATGNIQTATRSFSTQVNYTYNGSAAQITGNGLPTAPNLPVTIDNSAGVTLSQATTVANLALKTGPFATSSLLTIPNGATVSRAAGSLTGTPTFVGPFDLDYIGATAVTTGPEAPPTFIHVSLLIANSAGVTLGADLIANFTSEVTTGSVFNTGAFTQLAGGNFTNNGTINVDPNGTLFGAGSLVNNGTVNVNGTLKLNQNGSPSGTNFVYGGSSTLNFSNTGSSYAVNNSPQWPSTNGPPNVTVEGSGGITMNVARTVSGIFQYAAGVSGAGNLTLNGTVQTNTGGFVSGSPTFGSSSLLKYNTGGTYGRNGEWLPGATSGAGYPHNVQLSNNTTLDLPNGSAGSVFQMSGSLTIDVGSRMQMAGSPPLTQPLNILGSVTNNGTFTLSTAAGGNLNVGGSFANSGTYTNNGRLLTFNGGAAQTWSDSNTQDFGPVAMNNSSGGVGLNSAISVQTLTLTNGQVTTTSSNLLTVNNTSAGAVSGGSAASYINGPLARVLPASLATGSVYSFPVGKSAFNPFELIDPTTTSGGTVTLRAEEFDGPSGGSAGTGLSAINNDRYWGASITNPGNFTNTKVKLTNSSGLSAANRIGKSATQAGAYDSIGGTFSGSTITSDEITSFSFFNIGTAVAPETDVSVSGGTLIISDANGGATADALTIKLVGSDVRISDPNNTLSAGAGATQDGPNAVLVPLSSITGNIQVNTLGGVDTLTLDLSGGDCIPASGLSFAGGLPTTAPGDKLVITGGSQGTVTYNYTNAHDGNVVMSNFGTVSYTGLEPISNDGTAADIVFNLPAGPAITAGLADDGTSGNTMSRLSGATFETTDFANPTGSLTINRGNAGDSLVVSALPDLTSHLTIGSALSPFSTVTFSGAITLAANNNLAADAAGFINLGNAASDLSTSGTGKITLTTTTNISSISGSSLSVVNGDLTLSANQQAITSTTSGGIFLNGCALTTTGTGKISLLGKGASTTGGGHQGIIVVGGSTISSTSAAAGAGTITLNGNGGTGSSSNVGVEIENPGTAITSVIGDISVTGVAGNGTSGANIGVQIVNGAAVMSSGTAKVTIDGTGSQGTSSNTGTRIVDLNTKVTSAGGDIKITGHGGAGTANSNHGVSIAFGALISATGGAKVTLDGTAGGGTNSSTGVIVAAPSVSDPTKVTKVLSDSGDIQITGVGGTGTGIGNIGININGAAVVAGTGSANVTINGTGGAAGASDCYGVDFESAGLAGTAVTAVNGNINVTGTATAPTGLRQNGIRFEDSAPASALAFTMATTGTGSMTLTATAGNHDQSSGALTFAEDAAISSTGANNSFIADTMDIVNDNVSINFGANALTLRQKTNGTLIDLGSATDLSANTLELSDGELDLITCGALNIGNSNSGAITFSGPAAVDVTDGPNIATVNLVTGGAINSNSTAGVLDIVAAALNLTSASGIDIEMNADTLTSSSSNLQSLSEANSVTVGNNDINASGFTLTLASGRFNTTSTGGDILANTVLVQAPATLGGTGSAGGTSVNGTVSPGTSPGILNTGSATFNSGSTLAVEIGGTTPGNAATDYDQLNVTGSVSPNGATLNLASFNSFAPTVGDSFVIINNDSTDPITTTFNGLAEGATIPSFLGSALGAQITYAGGTGSNDVVLSVVNTCPTTFTVDSTADDPDATPGDGICDEGGGDCTLRAAIQESNALTSCAPVIITFNLGAPGTHFITPVSSALPAITRSVTIQGPTDASVHVTGDFNYRVFEVTTASVVNISNLTIADAYTASGRGPGLLNSGTATVTVTAATFKDSFADDAGGGGGAVANTGAGITNLSNCTFSLNGSSGDGGAIYATAGTINILNTTIYGNYVIVTSDPANGGGVANGGGTINVKNTIIAGNYADTSGFDVFGAFTSQGNNLISDGTDSTGFTNGVNGDQVGAFNWPIDPGLEDLNDNGGPTETFALLPFSPAVEAGNNTGAPATDQRGITRPQGALVDIGALEMEAIVVNTTADPGDGTCTATPGGCTLREAIDAANAAGAPRMIAFNIPYNDSGHYYYTTNGAGGVAAANVQPTAPATADANLVNPDPDYPHSWWSIRLATASGPLPPITSQVFINGYSQPGAVVNTKHLNEGNDAILRIELNGTNLSTGYGLDFESGAEGSKTSGLTINHFAQIGIYVNDYGYDTISGNFIGTDVSGTLAQGGMGTGILLEFGENHSVGGEVPAARNLISGHTSGTGLDITGSDNLIEGNYIGTDRNGSVALANNIGVMIQSCGSGNTIGCLVLDGGNLISGNTNSGVFIDGSVFNAVVGNFIGTNRLGTAAIGNGIGVNLLNAADNLIGFLPGGPGNVISGNAGDGILIKNNPASDTDMFNVVHGNLIGTSITGLAAVPNGGAGVELDGSSGNEIGCTEPDEANVISGNLGDGVEITGGAENNLVQGNFIGVGLNTTTPLGNGGSGVEIHSTPILPSIDNLIGPGFLEGDERNRLDSKTRVGAASLPDVAKPNRFASRMANASRHRDRNSSRNRIAGAKVSGAAILFPNLTPPPALSAGANIIANNTQDGVRISGDGDINNIITQNSIYANGKLGINLVGGTEDTNGVTANDVCDNDEGPNHLQNFPEISDADVSTQTVTGTLACATGGPFTIEFFTNVDCDGSGNGEGKTYFGSTQTYSSNFNFTASPSSFTAGQIITATATDADGNTSEFSPCFAATPTSAGADLYIEKTDSPDPVTIGAALTYTLTVFNNGPTAATNVQVTDTLPLSVTFVSSTPSQGSCSGTTTVTCNLGTINNGANATVEIVVTAPNTAGPIANSASVSSPNDGVNENNSESEGTQVNACPTTFTLTSTGDEVDAAHGDGHCDTDSGTLGDQCTLRAAIEEANSLPACGVITIDATGVNGSISLGTALPGIAHNVNINGPGPSLLTVERGNPATFRIFFIDSLRTVNIRGLNIANGSEFQGGNVNNQGTTTLTNCLVRGGQATHGGGIYNGSELTLINSTVRDNSSDYGGGISSQVTLTMTNSLVSGNTAGIDGGGILNGATLTATNTTVSGNSANNDAGGIYSDLGPLRLTNVTVTNNRADNDNNASGTGGGILRLGSTVTLRNTIVALNFKGPGSSTRDDVKGTFTSDGHNLIGDETGSTGFGSTGDQVGTGAAPINPLLGALSNNGGSTLTHPLLYNSPAVDKGDNCVVLASGSGGCLTTPLTTDQRGSSEFERQSDGDLIAGAIVDIGAYERQETERRPVPTGDTVQVDLVDVRLTFPCVPIGDCGGARAKEVGAQPKANAITPAAQESASISVIDPASQPAFAGYGTGNTFNPPLPAFDVSTSSTTYDTPVTVCSYLPTITNQTFFEGLKLLHNEGGVMVDVTTTATFSQKTVCGSVNSLSPFVVAHALTPTASDGSVSGQILDNNGNPVEGAAVRMTGTQNRLTVTDAAGHYNFDDVDTNGFYTVVPSRANFAFSPTQRAFTQQGQNTNAAFTATLANAGLNPLDTTVYFVRQQYVDFLGREPDEAGLNFWVNNIESCGSDAPCREAKRIDTSAAFFLSIEFQETGYLVYRMYATAYGDKPGSPVPLERSDFGTDAAAISNGVVVLKSGWETVLENNKHAYAALFVQRPRFVSAYPGELTPTEFVDRLFTSAGVTPSVSERAAAINEFRAAATSVEVAARGRALRRVAENGKLVEQEFNQAFVLMEYFGYLRRNPSDAPERTLDYAGYNFWLSKLNTFNGNFRNAEMVKAFLSSIEYRERFPR